MPLLCRKIHSWYAAIEAEVYSYLRNSPLCLNALARAKDTTEKIFLALHIMTEMEEK